MLCASRPLFVITDGTASLNLERTVSIVSRALEGAGKMIAAVLIREQVSPNILDDESLHLLCERLRPLCHQVGSSLLLHRNVELSHDYRCDGVHLQTDPHRVQEARTFLGTNAQIGYSAHSVHEIQRASDFGASYCFFSPIFPPQSKVESRRSIGLEYLREACKQSTCPIVALGGITPSNAGFCRAAGAHGLAAIGSIFHSADPKLAAAEITEAWFNEPS